MAIRNTQATMAVFGAAFKLGHSVSITVPSTVDVSIVADTSEWRDKAMTLLSQEFGGSTATQGLGGWVSETQGLIKEDVTLVTSYANRLKKSSLEKVKAFALDMKSELKQEAVLVAVDGAAFLL
jgi:hypothetical protein